MYITMKDGIAERISPTTGLMSKGTWIYCTFCLFHSLCCVKRTAHSEFT